MTPIIQFRSECSLACVASLNNFSQADYVALSRLVRIDRGASYLTGLRHAIRTGIAVAKELGLFVPEGYPDSPRLKDTGPDSPDFSGKGIVRIKFIRKRCRKYTFHVLTFDDGVFYETDGRCFYSWDALAADYKAAGSRELAIVKIFK